MRRSARYRRAFRAWRRDCRCCSQQGSTAAELLNRFVELSATNHAKIYGLHPRKGTIAIGSDADIAIWDPLKKVTISREILHDNMDYTPYEGIVVTGWPVITISRGAVICENGRLAARPGRGEFLTRDPEAASALPSRVPAREHWRTKLSHS